LIFSGHSTQGQRQAVVRQGADNELLQLQTPSGERVVALFGKALDADGKIRPDAASRPTIIWFYGNAMCLADCYSEFGHFRRLGANVIVPEYLGYGMSSGQPGEQGCYDSADAAYEYLLTRQDIDHSRIIPAGWSLGAGAAIDLASRKAVAGLITFSAFTSMPDMGHHLFPWLPTSLLVKHRFDNERKIARISCPILLGHGTVDSIVPFPMSAKLKAAAKAPLTTLFIDGADHNDLFEVGGDALWSQVGNFIEKIAHK
jgi:fermentation-respiration switch protein FrsA (DUF1100 family)